MHERITNSGRHLACGPCTQQILHVLDPLSPRTTFPVEAELEAEVDLSFMVQAADFPSIT